MNDNSSNKIIKQTYGSFLFRYYENLAEKMKIVIYLFLFCLLTVINFVSNVKKTILYRGSSYTECQEWLKSKKKMYLNPESMMAYVSNMKIQNPQIITEK